MGTFWYYDEAYCQLRKLVSMEKDNESESLVDNLPSTSKSTLKCPCPSDDVEVKDDFCLPPLKLIAEDDLSFPPLKHITHERLLCLEYLYEVRSYNGLDLDRLLFNIARKADLHEVELCKDLSFLASLIVSRGTKISTSVPKLPVREKERFLELVRRYEIKDGKPTSNTDITLGRIACIVPQYMSYLIHIGKVTPKIIGSKNIPNLPRSLCFPTAVSIIPISWPNLFIRWKNWFATFSAIDASKELQLDYGYIPWKNRFFSEESRLEHMRRLGLDRDCGQLTENNLTILKKVMDSYGKNVITSDFSYYM